MVIVLRASDVDEAVRIANDCDYGLTAAVFGRDVMRALRSRGGSSAASAISIAATVFDEPQLPFGGCKASGYGRFGGKAAVEHFTELRTITIATGRQDYSF